MKLKVDKQYFGLAGGIILPLIVLFIVAVRAYQQYDFGAFINYLKTVRVLSKMVSLCILPNLLLFFIFIWTNKNSAARGVLGATILWGVVIVYLRFFL